MGANFASLSGLS